MRILFVFIFLSASSLFAQDDLFDLISDDNAVTEVRSTFKGTRVINGQSIELPSKRTLQFVIAHRFGTINSGAYELWGLDQAQMRMSLDYGVCDRLALGLARNSFQKTFEGSMKSKLIKQKLGNASPVSVSSYHVMFLNSMHWQNRERENLFSSRLSYAHQIMIARKFNSTLSLQLTPSFIHRNLVETETMNNDYFALGYGGRFKISKRVSLNAEYFQQFNRPDEVLINSLSVGFDIETGGHVFQLHVTNSQGMFERSFIGETAGSWSQGDIYFGFNISRVFAL